MQDLLLQPRLGKNLDMPNGWETLFYIMCFIMTKPKSSFVTSLSNVPNLRQIKIIWYRKEINFEFSSFWGNFPPHTDTHVLFIHRLRNWNGERGDGNSSTKKMKSQVWIFCWRILLSRVTKSLPHSNAILERLRNNT